MVMGTGAYPSLISYPSCLISVRRVRVLALTEGQKPTPDLLERLLTSRPGGQTGSSDGINFTQFLAMMGERLLHLDPEHDLLEAFACFDDGDKGYVEIAEVRKHLAEMGDHMDEDEVCFFETWLLTFRLSVSSRARLRVAAGSTISSGQRSFVSMTERQSARIPLRSSIAPTFYDKSRIDCRYAPFLSL